MWEIIEKAAKDNGLVTAFAVVGLVVWFSGAISRRLTFGRVHGSAIAIFVGLALAYVGGKISGGSKGLADLTLFSGIGLMGGNHAKHQHHAVDHRNGGCGWNVSVGHQRGCTAAGRADPGRGGSPHEPLWFSLVGN